VGRVQGVGFRLTAQDLASRFGLTGWVRNEPDGSVSAEVQGPPSQIDACLEAIECQTAGRVDRRDESPIPPVSPEQGFEIRF